jgi:hypothetical protein
MLRRITVTIFKQLDSEARAALEVLAAQFLAEQERVGKRGPHCFFCGSMEQKIDRCNCGYGSIFGCSDVWACPNCVTAHRKLASHFERMFSFPKSNRVDSRRAAHFRHLCEASEKVDPKLCRELCQTDAWDDRDSVFKEKARAAFRRSNFTKFQSLVREIAARQDEHILQFAKRLFK